MTAEKSSIDKQLIRDITDILTNSDLHEIEIEKGDFRIRVSRKTSSPGIADVTAPTVALNPSPIQASATTQNTNSIPVKKPASSDDPSKHPGCISSPMVGTAYLSPAPGADPFLKVGDTVKEGQTLMIIEAMKTMNQIPTPRNGKVTSILVTDGQPVEYGEPLVIIE